MSYFPDCKTNEFYNDEEYNKIKVKVDADENV